MFVVVMKFNYSNLFLAIAYFSINLQYSHQLIKTQKYILIAYLREKILFLLRQ